jgi:hypothetical protein
MRARECMSGAAAVARDACSSADRALCRCYGDQDGGPGSLGTLTRAYASADWAAVGTAGCCCANPNGSLRACRSAGTSAPELARNAATALALRAGSTFSTLERSLLESRPPCPHLPSLGLSPRRLGAPALRTALTADSRAHS